MPENQDPDNDQDEGSVGSKNVQRQREHIKSLEQQIAEVRAEAETARAAAAEKDSLLAGFQRSAAFDRLNIPPTGPGKLFRDTYQGDLADDAILAKAAEYGVVQPATTTTAPTIPGIDLDAWARQQASLTGSANAPQSNAMEQLNAVPVGGGDEREKILAMLRAAGVVDEFA